MRTLVFATNNRNKLEEIQEMLGDQFELKSLKEIGCIEDIPETAQTLSGNAMLKARHVADRYKMSVFADDTGLEVKALDGAPGVRSARYAGENKNSDDNMALLLRELESKQERAARFRTCIALILIEEDNTEQVFEFEGEVKGAITASKSGAKGFGYDPVFMPEGESVTFAEMDMHQKNEISHRGRAFRKMVSFLKELE